MDIKKYISLKNDNIKNEIFKKLIEQNKLEELKQKTKEEEKNRLNELKKLEEIKK